MSTATVLPTQQASPAVTGGGSVDNLANVANSATDTWSYFDANRHASHYSHQKNAVLTASPSVKRFSRHLSNRNENGGRPKTSAASGRRHSTSLSLLPLSRDAREGEDAWEIPTTTQRAYR